MVWCFYGVFNEGLQAPVVFNLKLNCYKLHTVNIGLYDSDMTAIVQAFMFYMAASL